MIEAVEEDQAVDARRLQLACEMDQGRVERRQLHCQWNVETPLQRARQVGRSLLHRDRGFVGVGGEEENVQLQRVGAGRLDEVSVL